MIMKILLAYFGVVLLACGCGLDEPALSDAGGSQIEFSASKMRIITKVGDSAETFVEGTDFRLFAVQSGTGWASDGTKFYNIEGTGGASGKVDYLIDGKKASYDVGKNLDFYGVTYGTSSEVYVDGSAGSAPTVSVSLSGNAFPDLMYSDNLKNKNSSSGLLNMEFRHTLSKLKFEILKQDESSDPVGDRKLENVTLKKVVLMSSASSATFNVKTGEWTETAFDARTVYDGTMKVENAAQPLKSEDSDIEMLAVPNSGQLILEVTLDMDGDTGNQEYKVVEYALMSSQTEKLVLEQNHEYTFSIVILKNDVRIVTVTPKVYEWIDVELDTGDAYFGQQVYFGGLMWMDRNLGAKSADCENDWYNSLGYYYQFGRNIPYMLDMAAVKSGRTSFKRIAGASDDDVSSVWDMRFLYTYDENSMKVSTAKYANHPSGDCYYDNLAKMPGELGEYSFILGFVHPTLRNKTQSWAITKDSFYDNKNENQTYWNDVENQPCPKGWRLPTKDDLYVFMPEDNPLMWEDSYVSGQTIISRNYHIYSEDAQNIGKWNYRWSYFAGRYKVDSTVDNSSEYSFPVSSGTSENPRVYGIKYIGSGKAYRVMFERIHSKEANNRDYVRISRFDTQSTDDFKLNNEGTQWNLHKFDWSTPAEYMDIPLCGYVYKSLNMDGAILRTSDAHSKEGLNWVMYLRSGSNGVCVTYNSRRNLCENIRCVRDVNAK